MKTIVLSSSCYFCSKKITQVLPCPNGDFLGYCDSHEERARTEATIRSKGSKEVNEKYWKHVRFVVQSTSKYR